MKLNKIFKEGKSTKITINLPENELSDIKAYAEYYKEVYNEEILDEELVRNIVKDFIKSDKKFSKSSNKNISATSAKKKHAA